MSETRFTWQWLAVIAIIGIGMGLAFGLLAGWIIFPSVGGAGVSGLSPSAQNDYIILVANTYANDQDDVRAKQRIAQLGRGDTTVVVERLAKALATRKDPSAPRVAELALTLGSNDDSLIAIAESVSQSLEPQSNEIEPPKVGRTDGGEEISNSDAEQATEEPASAEPTPRKKKKQTPAATAPTEAPVAEEAASEPTEEVDEPEPTDVPAQEEPTQVPPTQPPPTPEPTAPQEVSAAPVTTEFIPSFPDKWWDAVRFIPAQVAPGQQYWRLKYARYCDWAPTDNYQTCDGFPGGGMGHHIYVMTVDENGACANANVNDTYNDGTVMVLTPDAAKPIAYAWNPYGLACDQDYEKEMYGEGNDISVEGLPSDKITALSLCAKSPPPGINPPPCGHAHVRYFLIFQRATR